MANNTNGFANLDIMAFVFSKIRVSAADGKQPLMGYGHQKQLQYAHL